MGRTFESLKSTHSRGSSHWCFSPKAHSSSLNTSSLALNASVRAREDSSRAASRGAPSLFQWPAHHELSSDAKEQGC